jgi:hypothetical protein
MRSIRQGAMLILPTTHKEACRGACYADRVGDVEGCRRFFISFGLSTELEPEQFAKGRGNRNQREGQRQNDMNGVKSSNSEADILASSLSEAVFP